MCLTFWIFFNVTVILGFFSVAYDHIKHVFFLSLTLTVSSARETGAYLRTEPSMGTLSFTKPLYNNVNTNTFTDTHAHTHIHIFYFLTNRAVALC